MLKYVNNPYNIYINMGNTQNKEEDYEEVMKALTFLYDFQHS